MRNHHGEGCGRYRVSFPNNFLHNKIPYLENDKFKVGNGQVIIIIMSIGPSQFTSKYLPNSNLLLKKILLVHLNTKNLLFVS